MTRQRWILLSLGVLIVAVIIFFGFASRGTSITRYKHQGGPIVITSGSSAAVQGFNGVNTQQTSNTPTSSLELLQAASGPQSGY